MRGPVSGVPPLLQPVAHALLQTQEEVQRYTAGFPDRLLWEQPAGVASVGFHLQHITGVIDRLFTYARGQSLSEAQFDYLHREGQPSPDLTVAELVAALERRVTEAVAALRRVDERRLTDVRYLGRKRIPTTLAGLLFHAAEHAQRHVGQLLVTIRFLQHGV